jgi:hypothetical protein
VGDQVQLGKRNSPEVPLTGPYLVTKVYKNRAIQIQKGIVTER